MSKTFDIPDSVMKMQDPQFKVSTLLGLLLLVHSYSCRALWQAVEVTASATATAPLLQEFIVKDFLFPSRNKRWAEQWWSIL